MLKGTASLPGGLKSVKHTTTDSEGCYEISKFGLSNYQLAANDIGDRYAIGWFQEGELIIKNNNNMPVTKRKTMHLDYHIVPYGILQINTKNISCFDSNDELKIFRTHSIENYYEDVPNPAIYSGCVDLVGSSNKAPMGLYIYSGTVTKNGITTIISDSIFLDSGESEVWNIYY